MSCTSCRQGNNQGNNNLGCCDLKAMDVVTPLKHIQNGDENFCFSEITDKICENLQNDEGIHPSVTHSNNDCDDLKALNDLAIGSLHNALMTLNMCDVEAYKCWLDSLLSWQWNVDKAIICAICGLWCNIHRSFENFALIQKELLCLENRIKALEGAGSGGLQFNFHESGSGITWKKHTGEPAWARNRGDKRNWAPVSSVNESNYWVDGTTIHIQYGGDGHGWAGARFLGVGIHIEKQTKLEDNSIKIEGYIELTHLSYFATGPGGITSHLKATMDGQVMFEHTGDTKNNYDLPPKVQKTNFSVILAPGATSDKSAIVFTTDYPHGEFSPNSFTIGLLMHNANKKTIPSCLTELKGEC